MQINNRYLISGLITKLKSDALVPNNQNTYTDTDFAYILSNELLGTVLPNIQKQKVDLLLTFKDFQTSPNVSHYPIPERATGQKLKTVSWKFDNTSGNDQSSFTHIPMISPESISSWNWQTQASWGFYVEGNDIVLYPLPNIVNTFRMWYFRRPNELVNQLQGAFITAINQLTNTITISNIPQPDASGSPWSVGDTLDIIRPAPPFNTIVEDAVITAISVTSYDITLSDVTGVQVNDTVALAGRGIVAQIPVELQQYLVQCGVVKTLEGLGDDKGRGLASDKMKTLEDAIFNTIAPRVDSDPPRCVGSSGIGLYNKPALRWGR